MSTTPSEGVSGEGVNNPEVTAGAEEVRVLEFADAPEAEGVAEDDALTKEPVPHGIFVPSGWVDSEGGTMLLAESVIVKRPVQALFELDGDVNW